MAESQHILSIEVDLSDRNVDAQADKIAQKVRDKVGSPIPVNVSGGGGGARPPRVATGAPFPSDEGPQRGTPSQEKQARSEGFASYAEKRAAIDQWVSRESTAKPLPQPGTSFAGASPSPTSGIAPPSTVARTAGNLSPADLAKEMRSTYMQQLERGDRSAALRTLGQMSSYNLDVKGLPSPTEYAAQQKQSALRDKLEDRYAVKYENRLATDISSGERDRQKRIDQINADWERALKKQKDVAEKVAQRVDKNFDAAGLSQQKQNEARTKRVNDAWDKTALAQQKAADTARKKAEAQQDRDENFYEQREAKEGLQAERAESGNLLKSFRRARQVDRAGFQAQLAGMKPRERIEALNQRLAEGVDPLEEAQLTKQRNSLQYHEDTREKLRIRLFGAAFFAYRGVSELANAATQNMEGDRVLRQQGEDAYLQRQLQITEGNMQGVSYFGRQLVARSGRIEARVADFFGAHDFANQVRTKSEAFNDDANQQALFNAQQTRKIELAKVQIGSESIKQQRSRELEENQAYNLGVHDPYRRARFEASDEFRVRGQTDQDNIDAIWAQLNAESDPTQQAILTSQLHAALKQQPLNIAAASKTLIAKTNEIRFQAGLKSDQMAHMARAMGFSQAGEDLTGAIESIIGKYNARFDPMTGEVSAFGDVARGDTLFDSTNKLYQADMAQARIDDRRNDELRQGRLDAAGDVLNRRPLQARIDTLNAQRRAALVGPDGKFIDPTSTRAREVNEDIDSQIKVERMQDADQNRLTQLNLYSERSQLQYHLSRPFDAVGTQMRGVFGQGLEQAVGFAQAGKPELASESLTNLKLRLQAERQDYLQGFRSTPAGSFDPRDTATSPRDIADVSKTLSDFADRLDKVADLLNNLDDLIARAVQNASSN